MTKESKLKVKIRCGDSDCANNLHCYQRAKARGVHRTSRNGGAGGARGEVQPVRPSPATPGTPSHDGRCRDCGAQLVDWERVRARATNDLEYTFAALRTECIRHHYWHDAIHQHAINYARRKGKRELRRAIRNHLHRAIGPAAPFRDGRQTPYGDDRQVGKDIVHFAQHAVACCCRKCAEQWHGIEQGRELTETELNFFSDLAMRYVEVRIPDLADDGSHVPQVRRSRTLRK